MFHVRFAEYTYKETDKQFMVCILLKEGKCICMSFQIGITGLVFLTTMLVIFWRPRGVNEAWPASIGAVIIIINRDCFTSRHYRYHRVKLAGHPLRL